MGNTCKLLIYKAFIVFLKRLFIYENIENPHPFFHADSWFLALILAFKIGILTVGYYIFKRNSNLFFVFSYWVLAMILLSPYGSTYTFILLLFPFLALLKSEITIGKKGLFFGILFLINNLSLDLFITNLFPFSYLRLFLLLAFSVVFVAVMFQKSVLAKAGEISIIIIPTMGGIQVLNILPLHTGPKEISNSHGSKGPD